MRARELWLSPLRHLNDFSKDTEITLPTFPTFPQGKETEMNTGCCEVFEFGKVANLKTATLPTFPKGINI